MKTTSTIVVTVLGTYEQVKPIVEKHGIKPAFMAEPVGGREPSHPVTVVEVEDSTENRERVKAFGGDFHDHLLSVAVTKHYMRKAEPLW